MKRKNPLKFVWLLLGFVSMGLGTVGIVLPILPTVPLYMATAICFAKSSEKLHNWFLSTNLYKKHLENFVQNKQMTLKSKLTVMCSITLLMLIGFLMMDKVLVGRVCLGVVWICHVIYFSFKIKTVPKTEIGRA